jgi:hypothetical protein
VVSAGEKGKGTGCRRRQPTGGMTKSNPEKKNRTNMAGSKERIFTFPPTNLPQQLSRIKPNRAGSIRPAGSKSNRRNSPVD